LASAGTRFLAESWAFPAYCNFSVGRKGLYELNGDGNQGMSITNICFKQFKTVFGSVENAERDAMSFIELPIDRIGADYDLDRMTPAQVANLATCAAWFVSDNELLNTIGVPIGSIRERIATHVTGACSWLVKYRK
jgi:hypothetical protein